MSRSVTVGAPGLNARQTRDEQPNPHDFNMHAHEDCELFYFVSGHGTYYVEGNEYRMSPGCVLLMHIGETHMLHVQPDMPYERFVINFRPELLTAIDPTELLMEPYLNRPVGQQNLYTPAQTDHRLIRTCLDGMLSSENESTAFQHMAVLSNLSVILFELRRAFYANAEPAVSAPQSLIAGVVEYINRNLTEDLSLGALSARFFLSKSYLNQQFRQATGTTIWDYVLLKRLMLARTSIRGGIAVTEAFQASGFNDYSSFYRRYKSRFGVSPKEDRPRSD